MRPAILGAATLALALSPGVVYGQGLGAGPKQTIEAGPDDLLNQIDLQQKLDAQLPLDLPFLDAEGNQVRLGDFFGERPAILALVYYECPMLCTMVLNGTLRAINVIDELTVGQDYDIIAVSIDPNETPDLALGKEQIYRSKYPREGSSRGWHFLVGDEPAIRTLAETVGFGYAYDTEADQYAHPSTIMVVTPDGIVSRYFPGIDYDPRTLRLSLVEAAAGEIGTFADQVFLSCFRYNPSEGKYSADIMAILRISAVLTILGIGLFMLTSFIRDRRRPVARVRKPGSSGDALENHS